MNLRRRIDALLEKVEPKDTIPQLKRDLSAVKEVLRRLEVRDSKDSSIDGDKENLELRNLIANMEKDIAESEKAK